MWWTRLRKAGTLRGSTGKFDFSIKLVPLNSHFCIRNPDTLERQERKDKKKRMDKDDEEKLMDFVERQVEKGRKEDDDEELPQPTEFVRTDEDEKISLQLKLAPKASISAVPLPKLIKTEFKDDDTKSMKSMKSFKSDDGKRKLSGLEEAMLEDMAMKKRKVFKEDRIKEEVVSDAEDSTWLTEVGFSSH